MSCFLSCFRRSNSNNKRRPKLHINEDKCSALVRNFSSKKVVAEEENVAVSACLSPHNDAEQTQVQIEPSDDCKEKVEIESSPGVKKKVTFDPDVKSYQDVAVDEDVGRIELESVVDEAQKEEYELQVKASNFPINYRYKNCEGSDDEDEYDDGGSELEGEEEDLEDCGDVGDGEANEEDSYGSFFSKSIVDEKKSSCQSKSRSFSDELKLATVFRKSNEHDWSLYEHSVLNPVENLTQWKEAKLQKLAPVEDCFDKENVVSPRSDPILKVKKHEGSVDTKMTPGYSAEHDVSVDASLSTWLVASDNSTVEGPQGSYSPLSNSSLSREDRPILGALTLDDLKHLSATSAPRRSPSRSPDETPIIGTVGSYWNSMMQRDYDTGSSRKSGFDVKGIPNTTSKYREDRKVNWHSTPFEVRLERALNKGSA